jgi:hypothetical protein
MAKAVILGVDGRSDLTTLAKLLAQKQEWLQQEDIGSEERDEIERLLD